MITAPVPKPLILQKAYEMWDENGRFAYLCDCIGYASAELQGSSNYEDHCDNAKALHREIADILFPYETVQTFLGYDHFQGRTEAPVTEFREKLIKDLMAKYPVEAGPNSGYLDGEPCSHPGCLHHVSHPCEGCGRIAGRGVPDGL